MPARWSYCPRVSVSPVTTAEGSCPMEMVAQTGRGQRTAPRGRAGMDGTPRTGYWAGVLAQLRAWIGWWLALAGLWLMLVDRTPRAELVLGAAVAAGGATAAVLVRAQRPVLMRP